MLFVASRRRSIVRSSDSSFWGLSLLALHRLTVHLLRSFSCTMYIIPLAFSMHASSSDPPPITTSPSRPLLRTPCPFLQSRPGAPHICGCYICPLPPTIQEILPLPPGFRRPFLCFSFHFVFLRFSSIISHRSSYLSPSAYHLS